MSRRTLGHFRELTLARLPFGVIHNTTKHSMNNDTLNPQTETPVAPVLVPEAPSSKPPSKAKPQRGKAPKAEKANAAAKGEDDGEASDRLPTSVKELKETKGGFVATLYLAGKSKDLIARDLKLAFKLSDAQAVKITRRITGRVRLYQRIFELVPVKR